MSAILRSLSLCFTAGAVGGLANAIFVWAFGVFGVSAMLHVAVAPAWTPAYLYQKLVWGGIWGLVFLLPLMTDSILARGAVFGLGPSAVQLLVVFPNMLGKGMFGLELGAMTPVFVLLANTVWGVVAALWMRMGNDQPRARRRL